MIDFLEGEVSHACKERVLSCSRSENFIDSLITYLIGHRECLGFENRRQDIVYAQNTFIGSLICTE